MEKFIFFASLKEKLSELNIPQDTIEKHMKIFEECFAGRSTAEIEAIIKGAGGIDGIINSVYKLEKAKANSQKTASETPAKADNFSEIKTDIPAEAVEKTDDNIIKEDIPTEISDKNTSESEKSFDNEVTREISTQNIDNIDEHIREAEEITKEIDRVVTIESKNAPDNAEFADGFDEYDFEVLFAEKISKPEKLVMALRNKMPAKVYKYTLPLSILVDVVLFLITSLLFPVLIASAVVVGVLYIAILVAGITFALVPLGYGAYMSFKIKPIGMYEISLGILILGFTMLLSILLYNYIKRLVPYLFKQLKALFKMCILVTKRYFAKPRKEGK